MPAPPKCPRCGASVTGPPDDLGFLKCGGCGARLRKAPNVKVRVQSPTLTTGSTPVPAAAAPPTIVSGNRDTASTDSLLARIEKPDASATLPPGRQSAELLKGAGYSPLPAPAAHDLEGVMRALQGIQKELAKLVQSNKDLTALVAQLQPRREPGASLPAGGSAPSRTRTSTSALRPMLIVDDDAALAEETRRACEKLGFTPVVADGVRAALEAMGRERPALVVFEPLLSGELSGRDFVNHLKSTMEWIEIPILIHTRATIANHEQARTDFGADDYVIKGEGSVDLLAKKAVRLTS